MKLVAFYVTYAKDKWLFENSLASFLGNATGLEEIVAVAPLEDREQFEPIENVHWHFIPHWPDKGYVWQQWVKLSAPAFVEDADWIIHIDSDCFAINQINLQEFCGLWPLRSYDQLPMSMPWKKPTEKAVGFPVENEYMRAFPFAIRFEQYEWFNEYIQEKHQVSLEEYLKNNLDFSEFNFMGTLAHHFRPETYSWIDTFQTQLPKQYSSIVQLWSHSPKEEIVSSLNELGVLAMPE